VIDKCILKALAGKSCLVLTSQGMLGQVQKRIGAYSQESGAEIYSSITIPPGAWIIDKGIDRHSIGYSDFGSTQLEKRLWAEHITHLAICGIATEYCIKADVLDALALGFRVTVLVDLIRPIDAHNGDAEKALTEMEKAGALLRESAIWMR